jgi:phospholipid/cholesterol/gamma-HCH transport system substrate-binding protein
VHLREGREADIKDFLGRLDTFVGGLDAQKEQIVRALESLDRLTARLVTERQTIATALEDIPPGVDVLADQRTQITELLTSLDELGDVAVRVIEASQQNTTASLESLRPILSQLNAAGADFPNSLELLTTYPFPRSIDQGIKGDYANLFVTLDLDLQQILEAETGTGRFDGDAPDDEQGDAATSVPPPPADPLVPPVPAVPSEPPLELDQVVPAPGGQGFGGLFDRLRSGGSARGGGLVGLLMGGLQ